MSASTQANDESAIRGVMSSYEEALNASNTAAVLPLYAEDGVFMPPFNQSAVGKAVVRKAYDAVFEAITVHRDDVDQLPDGTVVLASNDMGLQALEIRHARGTFWGVQYHPEYSYSEIAATARSVSSRRG